MVEVFGVEIAGLPDDAQALEVLVLVKGLDADGVTLFRRQSLELLSWEALGMLEATAALVRDELLAGFEEGTD